MWWKLRNMSWSMIYCYLHLHQNFHLKFLWYLLYLSISISFDILPSLVVCLIVFQWHANWAHWLIIFWNADLHNLIIYTDVTRFCQRKVWNMWMHCKNWLLFALLPIAAVSIAYWSDKCMWSCEDPFVFEKPEWHDVSIEKAIKQFVCVKFRCSGCKKLAARAMKN